MKKKKVAVVFGTRPEAIKMAPVILELKRQNDFFETIVIVSAQHRDMMDQVLEVFDIRPDYDLNIMKASQTLTGITCDVLTGIERVFLEELPDLVLVHGDTTTSFSAALASFYQQIPVGHVEAGLRTFDKKFPYPEEGNRQLIDNLTNIFFVPTETSKRNLLIEGKNPNEIIVTGNTVIDAINYTKNLSSTHFILDLIKKNKSRKWILVTMHRRENQGKPMIDVFNALKALVDMKPELSIVLPVHLNPVIQKCAKELLGEVPNIYLLSPLEVGTFHLLMQQVDLILTDSGGMQEEAPALNKPVLVLRDMTERPEGVEAGTLKVIGTQTERVIKEVNTLLENKTRYDKMAQAHNPYGDGTASIKIVEAIKEFLNRGKLI